MAEGSTKTSTEEEMQIFWEWFKQWGEAERRLFLEKLLPKITPHKLFAMTENMLSGQKSAPSSWRECGTFEEQLLYFHTCLDRWTAEEGNRFLDHLEEIDYGVMSEFYDKIAAAVKEP